MNGQNAIVAGGLFVNNGQVTDNSALGISTIIADYGALVKGGGQYDNSPITRNGGKFQAGNSPGVATMGRFVFGPGGVSNYVFAIDDATGQAGPTPDALGHVSGWGLVKAAQWQRAAGPTSGDFVLDRRSEPSADRRHRHAGESDDRGNRRARPDGRLRSVAIVLVAGGAMDRNVFRADRCGIAGRGDQFRHQRLRESNRRHVRLVARPGGPIVVIDLHAERRAGAGDAGAGRIGGRVWLVSAAAIRRKSQFAH